MLWFGWFGFNAGSAMGASPTAVLAFATTNTASAAAMLAWIFFDWMRGLKPSALGACIGAVVGLVAITPAAGFVTIRESIVIGVVASVVSNLAVHWKSRSEIDDTLDVFPCHGVGGMTGMVLTGVFAKDVGLTSGKYGTFLYHLVALVIVAVFAFVGSWILYKITDWVIPLRVSTEQETLGLDLSQHGESALASAQLGGAHANGSRNGVHGDRGPAKGDGELTRDREHDARRYAVLAEDQLDSDRDQPLAHRHGDGRRFIVSLAFQIGARSPMSRACRQEFPDAVRPELEYLHRSGYAQWNTANMEPTGRAVRRVRAVDLTSFADVHINDGSQAFGSRPGRRPRQSPHRHLRTTPPIAGSVTDQNFTFVMNVFRPGDGGNHCWPL